MNRLQQISESIEGSAHPPVHTWQPERVGDIDIHVDHNGIWQHEGAFFERERLVILFASILWHENQQYYLVTPAEKLKIKVDDVPFIVHQAERVEGAWLITTNVHEQIIIGHDHPVELRLYQGVWLPYVRIRYDLWARVNRSIYYQWVEAAMNDVLDVEGLSEIELVSGDYRFAVAKS